MAEWNGESGSKHPPFEGSLRLTADGERIAIRSFGDRTISREEALALARTLTELATTPEETSA